MLVAGGIDAHLSRLFQIHDMMIDYSVYRAGQLASAAESLAELRVGVFRGYPYLYDGTLEGEREYIDDFRQCPSAMTGVARDGERIVGVVTCQGLDDAKEFFRKPFVEAGLNSSEYAYFGECILLAEYRGLGIGRWLVELASAHALAIGKRKECLCMVDREADHPLRPTGYMPVDGFCRELGFVRHPELKAEGWWEQVDGEPGKPVFNTLTFWTRG